MENKDEKIKVLYGSEFVYSFGQNFAGGQTVGASFVNMYTVELGATPTQIGLFHSVTISVQNMLQFVWGHLSDRIGRRTPFVFLGGLGISLLWIPILFASNPTEVLILIALQAIFSSMRLPNRTALIGDLAPDKKRGTITANINFFSTLAGLFAVLFSGFIMYNTQGSLKNIYSVPFMSAALFGILGSFAILFVGEKRKENVRSESSKQTNISQLLAKLKESKDYQKYLVITLLSTSSLVLLLPVISIMTIVILEVDKLTFAFYGVVRSVTVLIFQKWMGKIVDLTGRKTLMVIQRLLYIIVPGLFVLAPNKYFIFLPYLLIGFLHAIEGTANLSYLLDVTPQEERGSFISLFSAALGLGVFFSSILSGYLIEYFSQSVSIIEALRMVALITTLLRVPTSFAYITLKEPRSYESTLSRELKKIYK